MICLYLFEPVDSGSAPSSPASRFTTARRRNETTVSTRGGLGTEGTGGLAFLPLAAEDVPEERGVEGVQARRDEVVEGPVLLLRELGRDQRRDERPQTWFGVKRVTVVNHLGTTTE